MQNPVDINFENLPDREIAERLYKNYGCKLAHYAIKSWQFDEDEAWDILYDTLYGFINSYADQTFASEKQVGTLVWKIFKNKLRDKLRQKKRKEKFSIDDHDSLDAVWLQHSEPFWTQENVENPILTELENLLDDLNDWERQLLLCRANNIPYKVVEEMTGKKENSLKVYYQRLKKKISKELEKNINIKEGRK